jgi:hypothetical protein
MGVAFASVQSAWTNTPLITLDKLSVRDNVMDKDRAAPSRGSAPAGRKTMPDINTEKVCFVIVKARELASEDEGVEADASNPSDDQYVGVTTENACAPVRAELAAAIDALDEDEQCELVALSWIGRGEFTAEEWLSAVAQARGGRPRPTSGYLLEDPLLASHLEYGLAEFGESGGRRAADRQ